jgi:hemerythrin-like domain-containing protein
MTATEILRAEHVLILRALTTLETAADRLASGVPPPAGWWTAAIAWLRGFADRTHHAREERLLFPAILDAGVPREGGPVAVMLEEHELGRSLIQAMETSAGPARVDATLRYVDLLRNHIDKENGILFPLADAVLDDTAQRTLRREFDAITDELGRDATLDGALAGVERLETGLGDAEPAGRR